jgi:hypothetical protein
MSGLERKIRQAPKRCIFCGSGKLSREHFWPEWAAPILPNGRNLNYYDFAERYDRFTGKRSITKHYRRQGPVITKRLRVVCGDCNSDWMNRQETAVRPILTPMATGGRLNLTAEAQLILARWITMKAVTAEHNIIVEVVTEQPERTALMEHGSIPDGMQIWIFRCGLGLWRSRYYREAVHLSLSARSKDTDRKNSQTVTFGFGDVLVTMFYTRVPGINIEIDFDPRYALKIWPPGGESLAWPPPPIGARAAEAITGTMERILDSPKVKRGR